jgi:hypothetical protein
MACKLASAPSPHLESEFRPSRNPKNDSTSKNHALEEGFLLQTIQRRLEHRAGIKIRPEPTGPLRGCIDEASPTAIRGWANCPAAPDTPISLDIFADGVYQTTILANAYRPDLREAGLGSGCHGFALPGLSGQIEIRRTLDSAPLARPQARAA